MPSIRIVRRCVTAAGFAFLLSPHVLANTYVVDDDGGPGVDFTDLPAAVVAAQPGDVLRVMAGTYSAFTCVEGLTILGYGAPTVNGEIAVSSIPDAQVFVLAGLAPIRILVDACDGTVILQELAVVSEVSIQTSFDVRLLDVNVQGGIDTSIHSGLSVVASRVEVVQSSSSGSLMSSMCDGSGQLAGPGVRALSSSRVHFVSSDALGASGGECWVSFNYAYWGGPGMYVDDSELILAGGGQSSVLGGAGGYAGWYTENCFYDGQGGNGLLVRYSDVGYSRATIRGADYCYSSSMHSDSYYFHAADIDPFNSTVASISPRHSTLALSGIPTPGQSVQITLTGHPGSDAWIWLGRQWILQFDAGVDIERAVNQVRLIHLGTMPASGSISVPLAISSLYPPGTLYGLQGECRFGSGETRRTNSIPIVVR